MMLLPDKMKLLSWGHRKQIWILNRQDAFGANFQGSAKSSPGEDHHHDLDTEVAYSIDQTIIIVTISIDYNRYYKFIINMVTKVNHLGDARSAPGGKWRQPHFINGCPEETPRFNFDEGCLLDSGWKQKKKNLVLYHFSIRMLFLTLKRSSPCTPVRLNWRGDTLWDD